MLTEDELALATSDWPETVALPTAELDRIIALIL
jgi:hypothetical protein